VTSQEDAEDDVEGPAWLFHALVSGSATPEELLFRMVFRLNSTPVLDDELCGRIGAGNLESLLREHEAQLWPEVERLARADLRFRRALGYVWASDSPMYERRRDLLRELEDLDGR
jgi:hypothetical protein